MLAANYTAPIAAPVPAQFTPRDRPPPAKRVVESTSGTDPPRAQTQSAPGPMASAASLSRSARQFAAILEATGNVHIAAMMSGFSYGSLDVYA